MGRGGGGIKKTRLYIKKACHVWVSLGAWKFRRPLFYRFITKFTTVSDATPLPAEVPSTATLSLLTVSPNRTIFTFPRVERALGYCTPINSANYFERDVLRIFLEFATRPPTASMIPIQRLLQGCFLRGLVVATFP